jgi:hypothetical protein
MVKIFMGNKNQTRHCQKTKKKNRQSKHQEKTTITDATQAELMGDHHHSHLKKFD